MRTISIEPVNRVEGEAKVVIYVDEHGRVKGAYYVVLSLRGFEAFCVGRPVEELPRITSTMCGVCSWAHHLASSKAVDEIFGRTPPTLAQKVRELAMLAQIIDSHLLHFTFLALPDLTFRNIVEVAREEPRFFSSLVKARASIVNFERILGGKPIHPTLTVPGGVSKRPSEEEVRELEKLAKDCLDNVVKAIDFFNEKILRDERFLKIVRDERFAVKSHYMALVGEGDTLSFYSGKLKILGPDGRVLSVFNPRDYVKYIEERVERWSYSKFPYIAANSGEELDDERRIVRVGPLARLNVCSKIPCERSRVEYERLLETLGPKPIHNTQAYHWARLIEALYCSERILEILNELDLNDDIVSFEGEPTLEGVGVVEAPRGTLIHHYRSDEGFVAREINIITPTTFNNPAVNREIGKICGSTKLSGYGEAPDQQTLKLIEVSIRAYDPCNSCSTHFTVISPRGVRTYRAGGWVEPVG